MAFIDPVSQLGIPLWLILVISVWETVWTGFAMWRAAKLRHVAWFVVFLLLNLLAIPEIIYLAVTRNKKRK